MESELNRNILKCTIEEWGLALKAKAAGPEEGKKMVLEFYAPRCKRILESDELCDFEKEAEYTFEEYLNLIKEMVIR